LRLVPWRALFGRADLWMLTAAYVVLGYIAYFYFAWFYLSLVNERGFSISSGKEGPMIPICCSYMKFHQMLRRMAAVVLLMLVFWPALVSAQRRFEPPPRVRLTGSILPFEDRNPLRMDIFTVFIEGKKRIFRVVEVEQLTGWDADGWRLLRQLFPAEMRFLGSKELTSLLQEPELMGKRLTLEGQLYVGSRMFFINIMEEAGKKSKRLQ
jgi:hypothetical protein